MYKAVFDTNVYISAIAFGGIPEELLYLARGPRRQFQLFASHDIIKEIIRVLISEKFDFTQEEIADVIASIEDFADIIEPGIKLSVIKHKPDNRILECAVKAKADYIVSGDKHLRALKEYEGTRSITPAQLLKLLEK